MSVRPFKTCYHSCLFSTFWNDAVPLFVCHVRWSWVPPPGMETRQGYRYPYNKVTGCLSVRLYVPKDHANRLTDIVILYWVASHKVPWESL